MADAYGKLTGRPGICMVTRGPGATHAAGGIHTAFQDSTPLILLIGQVGREMMGREAFQEIDYRQMFGPMAKWVAQIDDAEPDPGARLARLPRRDLRAARGRSCSRCPRTCSSRSPTSPTRGPTRPSASHPAAADVERAQRAARRRRERPLVVVGGAPWSAEAHEALDGLVRGERRSRSPPAWRRQDYVDNTLATSYVGHLGARPRPAARPARARRRRPARDRRPAERDHDRRATRCSRVPDPAQALIHVTADPDELGRVYAPDARRSPPRPDAFAARARGAAAARPARAGRGRAQARAGLPRQPPQRPAARRRSTWAR